LRHHLVVPPFDPPRLSLLRHSERPFHETAACFSLSFLEACGQNCCVGEPHARTTVFCFLLSVALFCLSSRYVFFFRRGDGQPPKQGIGEPAFCPLLSFFPPGIFESVFRPGTSGTHFPSLPPVKQGFFFSARGFHPPVSFNLTRKPFFSSSYSLVAEGGSWLDFRHCTFPELRRLRVIIVGESFFPAMSPVPKSLVPSRRYGIDFALLMFL